MGVSNSYQGLDEGISHPTGHYVRADHPGLHEGISHPTGHYVRADHPGLHEGISHPTGHYVRADHPGLHEGISHPTGHYVRADHPGLHEGISHPTGHYVRADHPGLHEGISHPTGQYVRADHPGLHEGISHPPGQYVRADHPGLHEGISHPTGHYVRANHPGLHEGISHPTGHYVRANHPGLHEGISHPTGHYVRADHPGLHEGISHPTGHYVRADHPGLHEGISHPTGQYVRADHPGLHEGISHPTGHDGTIEQNSNIQIYHSHHMPVGASKNMCSIDLTKQDFKMIDVNDFELAPITKVKECDTVTDDTDTSCRNQSKQWNMLKIVLGTFSQSDNRFHISSRGRQCTCNAVVSICAPYSCKFTSKHIDDILYEGDRLYNQLKNLLHQASGVYNEYLTFAELELLSPLSIFDKTFSIDLINNSLCGSLQTQTDKNAGIYSLQHAISIVMSSHRQALLMMGTYAMALTKTKENKICLFDSHSHGKDGSFHDSDGAAAYIIFFQSEKNLIAFLQQNFKMSEPFELQPINVKSIKAVKSQTEVNLHPVTKFTYKIPKTAKTHNRNQKKDQKEYHENYNSEYIRHFHETHINKFSMPVEPKKIEEQLNLQNYFQYQQDKLQQKSQNSCENKKKSVRPNIKSTNKNKRAYMKQKRLDIQYKSLEHASNVKFKQNQRRFSKKQKDAMQSLHNEKFSIEKREKNKILTLLGMQNRRQNCNLKREEQNKQNLHRQLPNVKKQTRLSTSICMKKKRLNYEYRKKENENKKLQRKMPDAYSKLKDSNLKYMRKKRQITQYKYQETKKKQLTRKIPAIRDKEKELDRSMKRLKRNNDLIKLKDKESKSRKRAKLQYFDNEQKTKRIGLKGKDLQECINKFHNNISTGPVFICFICNQTWFKHSVSVLSDHLTRVAENILGQNPTSSSGCKYELRSADRRVAKSVANIFFKLKKVQLQQICGKVHLVMRKCQNKGQKITAKDALNPDHLDKLVRLDEGYYIFRSLRNTPAYFENKKRHLFAMIRQLGLPTWLMSLSSADSKWIDLLQILGKLVDNKSYSPQEIEDMDWSEKCRLVQSDPVTTSRYFDNRVHEFMKIVLKSHHHPLGKIKDHFIPVEFQQRGSPHVHMLLWIESAPQYHHDEDSQIIQFIGKHVSCSSIVPEEHKKYLEYQRHKHSRTCRKNGKAICRFGHPIPPMRHTTILTPLEDKTETDKQNFLMIKSKLEQFGQGEKMNFQQFLADVLHLDEESYIRAIRTSISSPKIFLKRSTEEIRINSYMNSMIHAWGANHDLQFVLDPYACAVYIVSYVSKSQRGMSALMDRACKEARAGNKTLKEQVRHIGNAFLNSVEISAQEASYLLLQMPLTNASREVIFINTSHPNDRTFLLKDQSSLEKLPENSTNIQASNIIKRYSQRPRQLQNWCLADYTSLLNIEYPKETNTFDVDECNDDQTGLLTSNNFESDSNSDNELNSENTKHFRKLEFKNGMTIKKRRNARVILYVRFNKENDPENFYRERLLLFLPWKNEMLDLKMNHATYEDAYIANKQHIDSKRAEYEHNAEILQQAMQDAQTEDYQAYDELAPGTQQLERDDQADPLVDSETYSFYKPGSEQHSFVDIGIDLGLQREGEIQESAIRLPENEYRALIQNLNIKQLEIYTHIIHWIKTKQSKSLNLFLTGGAGVGKSVVITALYQTLHRYLCSTEGGNTNIVMCIYRLCSIQHRWNNNP